MNIQWYKQRRTKANIWVMLVLCHVALVLTGRFWCSFTSSDFCDEVSWFPALRNSIQQSGVRQHEYLEIIGHCKLIFHAYYLINLMFAQAFSRFRWIHIFLSIECLYLLSCSNRCLLFSKSGLGETRDGGNSFSFPLLNFFNLNSNRQGN